MALTKVTGKGLDNNVVDSTKLSTNSVTETKIASGAVTSAKISDGTVSADDLASSLDLSSKTVTLPTTSVTAAMLSNTLDLSSKTVTLPQSATATLDQNIALLGFKMAITDGLTVFNLVDGVVDEFEDESGTDGSASTNLNYNSTDDYYINSNSPDGNPIGPNSYSAGFSMSAITEPDTSVTGTNPAQGSGTYGTFTVPNGMTSVDAYVFGAGGGTGFWLAPHHSASAGGGGGFTEGTISVSPGQVLYVNAGEGGRQGGPGSPGPSVAFSGGGSGGGQGSGGGLSYVGTAPASTATAPQIMVVAGSGGGGAYNQGSNNGGVGGGLTGSRGNSTTFAQTSAGQQGGGGGQSSGGQASACGVSGTFLTGGAGSSGGGAGAGYYGGGGSGYNGAEPGHGAGGGGSSYYGHPQVTSGSTEAGGESSPNNSTAGGELSPYYPQTGQAGRGGQCTPNSGSGASPGNDGYVFLVGSASISATTTSSTIISDPFTSTTVPTTARIVVFEENVGTPTLNTDVIASVSRNNGSNYTTATLTDSGYVTGSSGQRILTGTATISGQPSGQSMRWKLELANNTVKIHGVALQWK